MTTVRDILDMYQRAGIEISYVYCNTDSVAPHVDETMGISGQPDVGHFRSGVSYSLRLTHRRIRTHAAKRDVLIVRPNLERDGQGR